MEKEHKANCNLKLDRYDFLLIVSFFFLMCFYSSYLDYGIGSIPFTYGLEENNNYDGFAKLTFHHVEKRYALFIDDYINDKLSVQLSGPLKRNPNSGDYLNVLPTGIWSVDCKRTSDLPMDNFEYVLDLDVENSGNFTLDGHIARSMTNPSSLNGVISMSTIESGESRTCPTIIHPEYARYEIDSNGTLLSKGSKTWDEPHQNYPVDKTDATWDIRVYAVNKPPVAIASADKTEVHAEEEVTLYGTQSYDPDPDDSIVKHRWEQISGPTVFLSDPTSSITQLYCSSSRCEYYSNIFFVCRRYAWCCRNY